MKSLIKLLYYLTCIKMHELLANVIFVLPDPIWQRLLIWQTERLEVLIGKMLSLADEEGLGDPGGGLQEQLKELKKLRDDVLFNSETL